MKLNPIHRFLSHTAVWGIRGLGAVVKALPPVAWGAMASAMTPFLWLSLSRYRKRTLGNLKDSGRSRKEARRLGMASFRSNLLVLFESLAMERIIARRGVRVERRISPGAERALKRLVSGEEPVVIGVSGHVGMWELMGAEVADMLAPVIVAVSARLVKNPVIADYIVKLRNGYGIKLVEKETMMRYILKMMRNKVPHVYVFLCDQHFKGGEKVPFMGRKACTVSMPATLAFKYKCPLLTGRCIRKSPGHYLIDIDLMDLAPYAGMERKDAVRAVTARINTYIGESISMAPEQWTWGHRRWRPCCEESPPVL